MAETISHDLRWQEYAPMSGRMRCPSDEAWRKRCRWLRGNEGGITLTMVCRLKYGKLEYWNLGILGSITPSFHYSIIPAFLRRR